MEEKRKPGLTSLEHIKRLKEEILLYSEGMNGKRYEDMDSLEQQIDNLGQALHFKLERFERHIGGESISQQESKEERLTAKMIQISNGIARGKVPVSENVVDEFLQALELFDLSRQAKEQGKTLALKDKYKGI